MGRIDEYIVQTPEGIVVRSKYRKRFYADLRETIRAQIFEHSDALIEKDEHNAHEVLLPSLKELPDRIDILKIDGDIIYLKLRFEAVMLNDFTDQVIESYIMEYKLPPREQ